jgi:DNA-binding Lrp family transcriptional regulator
MASAYVLISTEPGKIQEVVSAVSGVSGVKQAHACWGQPDVFAFVEVADDKALADTVLSTIQSIPGVRATETHVVVAA